jgi:hypothetical protein
VKSAEATCTLGTDRPHRTTRSCASLTPVQRWKDEAIATDVGSFTVVLVTVWWVAALAAPT